MREYFVWLAKFVTLLFVLLVAPLFLILMFVSRGSSFAKNNDILDENGKNVAVVEMKGEITDTKEIVDELYKQANNKKVKGIVLRIDSPGGAVAPSQDVYETVKKLKSKKPIVVSMGSTAASGGLYSALSASKIFCQPGTLTGSIGVIMQVPNVKKITDTVGFEMVTITSGKYKDVGNMFRKMTDDDRALLDGIIGTIRNEFVQAVVDGRGLPREAVEQFADGRVIVGSKALELGLVDKFGDIYDAAREVFELIGEPLPAGEVPHLYYPDDSMKKFKKLLEGAFNIPLQLINGGTGTANMKLLYM